MPGKRKNNESQGTVQIGVRLPRSVHEALRRRVFSHEAKSLNNEIISILLGERPAVKEEELASARSFFTPSADIETLANQQGVAPVTDAHELLGDFWPEEENTEDMLATLREWRADGEGEAA